MYFEGIQLGYVVLRLDRRDHVLILRRRRWATRASAVFGTKTVSPRKWRDGFDQPKIARSLANSRPLALANSFSRSSTVSFCFSSPSTSTTIWPSCIIMSRLP